jgi:hypothetical protein
MSRRVTLLGVVFSILFPAGAVLAEGPGHGRPLIPSEFLIETLRQIDALRLQENRRLLFEGELVCRRQPNACEPLVTIQEHPDLRKDLDKVLVPSESARPPIEGLR